MDKCNLTPVYTYDEMFAGCASVFAGYAEKEFGVIWTEGTGGLTLKLDEALPKEGYSISCDSDSVTVYASTTKGMHNGLADLFNTMSEAGGKMAVREPCVTENPDCSYRGLMVDLARQWHPVKYILDYIDLCWKSRASHFQLHFTDSQSFTLPISAYPKLSTEGRTYSKDDIQTIVKYADERGITLVPEVDIPGHTTQFFLKYPEIFGTNDVLPADDEVFSALRTIFTEVAEMFPNSPMIHIGGDEANISGWDNCPRTQKYMAEHGIANIHEMYAEYIRIVTDMILGLGRTPVVWEGFAKEYNDRIDKRTIVIAWESYYQPAYDLAASGFTLINSSWKPLYIVTPSTHWTAEEIEAHNPWRWDHWWQKSVAYPDGYDIDRKYPVLGEQVCAWGDNIANWENWEDGVKQEYALVAERLPVMCEKLWKLEK